MKDGVFLTMTQKDGRIGIETEGDNGDILMALAMGLNDLREKTGKDGYFIGELFSATYYAVWSESCKDG